MTQEAVRVQASSYLLLYATWFWCQVFRHAVLLMGR